MTRTGYQFEKLWTRPQKVDNLGDKEQEQCFAEMTENSHNGKGHARKVAKGVSHKDSWKASKEVSPTNFKTSNIMSAQ